jgi:ABC-type cobalt transport system substrate-binding protein
MKVMSVSSKYLKVFATAAGVSQVDSQYDGFDEPVVEPEESEVELLVLEAQAEMSRLSAEITED